MSELMPTYDFGRRQDVLTDEGDIMAIEPSEAVDYYDQLAEMDAVRSEEGVSVSLIERHRHLKALATIYAAYAKAEGMNKAVVSPRHRPDLRRRYRDPEDVASSARAKAHAELRAEEATLLEPLLMSNELMKAGFEVDAETETLRMAIGARAMIGVGVGKDARNAAIKGLYVPKD